jgi:hypothetical protein
MRLRQPGIVAGSFLMAGRVGFEPTTIGLKVLTLLEAFVQCVLKPVYEEFASQK